jgi:hypothetical protein
MNMEATKMHPQSRRRRARVALAAMLGTCLAVADAAARAWPAKPVRIVTPFPVAAGPDPIEHAHVHLAVYPHLLLRRPAGQEQVMFCMRGPLDTDGLKCAG